MQQKFPEWRPTEGRQLTEDFESALARLEADALAAQRAAENAVRANKRLNAAAKTGDIAAVERSLAEADRSVGALREQQANTRAGWSFDATGYIERDDYQRELVARARSEGLQIHDQDGRLFSYPVLLRILKGSDIGALTIDRKKVRTLRPSYLVAQLRMLRDKPPKSKDKDFLKSLYEAYCWVARQDSGASARGPVVKLADIYRILTLFPGHAREYSKQEFTRDVYLLDRSGLTEVEGESIEFAASTGTKTRDYFLIIDEYGQERAYYGVSFARIGR